MEEVDKTGSMATGIIAHREPLFAENANQVRPVEPGPLQNSYCSPIVTLSGCNFGSLLCVFYRFSYGKNILG